MSAENVQIIRGLYESFAKGDVPAVLGAMSPDIVWNEAENFPYADRNPYVGPQAILMGVFARLAGEWDGFAVEPGEVLDAGDHVVVLGRYRATYRPNGKGVHAQMAHIWRFKDGKIAQFQQYTDTKQFTDAVAAQNAD